MRVAVFACLMLLLTSSVAGAAPPKGEPARRAAALEALSTCRKESDGAVRLACYDKAAGALDEAEAKGQVVVLDREQVRTVRRQAFGFEMPSFSLFNPRTRAPADEQVDRVTYALDHVGHTAAGAWVLFTTEGVNWVQTDDEPINTPPHKGSELKVRRAAMASYFCNVDGQRAVRCTRQR